MTFEQVLELIITLGVSVLIASIGIAVIIIAWRNA